MTPAWAAAQWRVGVRAEAKGPCWQSGDLPPSHAPARTRTWENWPQSKGTLGGGDASHDTVKQEADLLSLGRGQEEDSSPCRRMDPSAWPGHRWTGSLRGKATTPPARSATQHLDEPLSPDNPACTSNTRLSRHTGHTPVVPHLHHQLGRPTSMCGRNGVRGGVLPCWSHARTGAGGFWGLVAMGGDEGILAARESPAALPPAPHLQAHLRGWERGCPEWGSHPWRATATPSPCWGPQTWFLYPGLW